MDTVSSSGAASEASTQGTPARKGPSTKKKLALICAMLHEPRLLVLDEPTSGLDPFATRTFHNLIRATVAAGTAVFYSTHLLDQAERLCDSVGILFQSRLAAFGPLAELREKLCEGGSLEDIFFQVAAHEDMSFLVRPGFSDVITLRVSGMHGVDHFGFMLKDAAQLDEAIAELERCGGRLIERTKLEPTGTHSAFLADPDGYRVQI